MNVHTTTSASLASSKKSLEFSRLLPSRLTFSSLLELVAQFDPQMPSFARGSYVPNPKAQRGSQGDKDENGQPVNSII